MNKLITLKTDNERARIVLSMLPGQPDNQIVRMGRFPLPFIEVFQATNDRI